MLLETCVLWLTVAWGQGLVLQCASDCLGERLAMQEAQRQAGALDLFRARVGRASQKVYPRMRLGRERMAAEGMSQPKMGQVSPLASAVSCSLGSKRPPHGPTIKRARGRGKEGACSSLMGKRNLNPGTCNGCTPLLSRRTSLALAVRPMYQLLSA